MVWYLVGINFITFIIYGLDKYSAVHKKYRVSEMSLFFLSIMGGGLGAILGMRTFHHKTRKIIFWVINTLSIIGWIFLVIYI